MGDIDMTAERPLAKVIHMDRKFEHYDWADLDNPYNFGRIFIKALNESGFRFKIGERSTENLLGIRATKETIDKIDEIAENLRMAGITDLYIAIDEGDLDNISEVLKIVHESGEQRPIFNEDFLRRSYAAACQRKQDKHAADPQKYPAPTDEEGKTARQVQFVLQGRSLHYDDMTNELSGIISKNIIEFPYLKP